jgi:hypothetical protein
LDARLDRRVPLAPVHHRHAPLVNIVLLTLLLELHAPLVPSALLDQLLLLSSRVCLDTTAVRLLERPLFALLEASVRLAA